MEEHEIDPLCDLIARHLACSGIYGTYDASEYLETRRRLAEIVGEQRIRAEVQKIRQTW